MKTKQDYVKFLLPLVAVVVIVESVILLMKVEEKRALPLIAERVADVQEEDPQIALSFATETRKMEVGKKYLVEVDATGLDSVALDSAELYVKYDPKVLKIGALSFSDKLPKPAFNKVSEKKELVTVTYLVLEEGGFELGKGETTPFLTFEVEPLMSGKCVLELATGNAGDESVTMFVENKTGRVLPFSVNSLNVEIE